MNPDIRSPSIQWFDGKGFYRSKGKRYFQRVVSRSKSELLHRAVWTRNRGPIPPKHHIHHKNGDPADNRIENLECIKAGSHLAMHMTAARRAWAARNVIQHAVPAAKAWHKSAKGRAWHAKQAAASYAKRPTRILVCEECGASFETRDARPVTRCSNKCRYRHQDRRKAQRKRASE